MSQPDNFKEASITPNHAGEQELFRYQFKAMASPCELVVDAISEEQAMAMFGEAISEVQRIEAKFSRYLADSVVSRVNASAGEAWIEHDEETGQLLDYANALFEMSDGLFDITSGVLRRAWNFKEPKLPAQSLLDSLLNLVGWDKVVRKQSAIKLPLAGMEIDFGGFGKEYATDRAAVLLANHGVKHGYVNLGGDLRVIGPKLDGQPWQMGIPDPRKNGMLIASIPIISGALATSGDYEKYFDLNGKRYCHIISPKTGMPVNYWQSVSILAPLTVAAGSFSTIAMLKQEEGLDWLRESGANYLAIDQTGAVKRMNE